MTEVMPKLAKGRGSLVLQPCSENVKTAIDFKPSGAGKILQRNWLLTVGRAVLIHGADNGF